MTSSAKSLSRERVEEDGLKIQLIYVSKPSHLDTYMSEMLNASRLRIVRFVCVRGFYVEPRHVSNLQNPLRLSTESKSNAKSWVVREKKMMRIVFFPYCWEQMLGKPFLALHMTRPRSKKQQHRSMGMNIFQPSSCLASLSEKTALCCRFALPVSVCVGIYQKSFPNVA